MGLYFRAGGCLRVSPHRLLLTHLGKVVEPQLSLTTQGIVNDSIIFAIVKGYGGGKTSPNPPGLLFEVPVYQHSLLQRHMPSVATSGTRYNPLH